MTTTDGGHAAPFSRWCEMSGSVSSEGCNHQRRLRIPQTSMYSSPRFSSNTLGLPDPLWNPFVKSSPWLDTQSQAYTTTYVALLIYVELARCGRCWYRSDRPRDNRIQGLKLGALGCPRPAKEGARNEASSLNGVGPRCGVGSSKPRFRCCCPVSEHYGRGPTGPQRSALVWSMEQGTHSNCCQRVPNRPPRGRRGWFRTVRDFWENCCTVQFQHGQDDRERAALECDQDAHHASDALVLKLGEHKFRSRLVRSQLAWWAALNLNWWTLLRAVAKGHCPSVL